MSNSIRKQPMTWRMSIGFVVLATLTIILTGYLISAGFLPIQKTIEFEGNGLQFMRVWMRVAIAIGVILPVTAFAISFKDSQSRKIFGFYLLLLGVQIVSEQVVSQRWMPSLVVAIGTLYTAFRVWQLWQGLRLMRLAKKQSKYKLLNRVLWLLLCFWLSNFVVLLTLAWPSIIQLTGI